MHACVIARARAFGRTSVRACIIMQAFLDLSIIIIINVCIGYFRCQSANHHNAPARASQSGSSGGDI